MSKVESGSINNTQQQANQPVTKIRLLLALLIAVCVTVLVVHWPVLSAQALSFDDEAYLSKNPLVQNPSWTSVMRSIGEILEPSSVAGYYQPLTMISLMADYALGGRADNLRQFHRMSLALHIANTALVIAMLYLLFGQTWVAAGLGLLFGLHPMTTNIIPWVCERKTLLAMFFSLLCLIFYVLFSRKNNWKFYLGCSITYILALMSKPTALPLPILMILLDFWPLRQLNKTTILKKIPLFIICGIAAIITYISQSRTARVVMPSEYGLEHTLLILCYNIVFYLYKIIWPANLLPLYAFPKTLGLSNPMVLTGIIGTCTLIVLLAISLRWTRGLLTGWLFFFVSIFPTMGVIGFTNAIAADKFAYLPSVGLLMILASLLSRFCSTGGYMIRGTAVTVIVLILAGAEAAATQQNLVHWRDTVSLYKYMLAGPIPDAAAVNYNLGNALQSQGKFEEAATHYRQAVQLKPDYADAYYNLANALKAQHKFDEAVSYYFQALQFKPDDAQTHNNLAIVLASQNKADEAIGHFQRALQLEPDYAEAHYNIGIVLESQNKFNEAISHYRKTMQLKPNDAEVLYRLGLALATTEQPGEALKNFRQAVHLKPDWHLPMLWMARILATYPDPNVHDANQAIEAGKRAAELTKYQDAEVMETLAASYAASGQFDLAIAAVEKALALAQSSKNNELADYIRKQMELYKQAKPQR